MDEYLIMYIDCSKFFATLAFYMEYFERELEPRNSGDDIQVETRVPIPNTNAKRLEPMIVVKPRK